MIKTTRLKRPMKAFDKKPLYIQKRIQKGPATRKGVSSYGTKYEKGEIIVHMSSARQTGEVYVLTMGDMAKIVLSDPAEQLRSHTKWLKDVKKSMLERRKRWEAKLVEEGKSQHKSNLSDFVKDLQRRGTTTVVEKDFEAQLDKKAK